MATIESFRPLSRGLFFNYMYQIEAWHKGCVFVPFLGDFFSMMLKVPNVRGSNRFSSPFSGTFFQ